MFVIIFIELNYFIFALHYEHDHINNNFRPVSLTKMIYKAMKYLSKFSLQDGSWIYRDCMTPGGFICKRSFRVPTLEPPPVPGFCPLGYFGMGKISLIIIIFWHLSYSNIIKILKKLCFLFLSTFICIWFRIDIV